MMSERKIGVVLSARDEFSGAVDRIVHKAGSASELIRRGLEPAETATLRVKERLDALRDGAGKAAGRDRKIGQAASSLDASTGNRVAQGGGQGMEPVEESVRSGNSEGYYAARLTAFREYSRTLEEEREKTSAAHRVIEMRQAEYEVALDSKKWALRVGQAETAAGAMSNAMQNLYVATGSKHRAMFEAMKAFAIAETVIQTYRAAMGAYAALAPIPVIGPALGAAAAAAAVMAGMARVETIRKTNPGDATGTVGHGGRANPSYSGGSFSAYPVPQKSEDGDGAGSRSITINIYNPLAEQNWKRLVEDNIIPALKDAGDRNIALTVRNMG